MRIVTPPYMQSFLTMDDVIGDIKIGYYVLMPRKELYKCPRCQKGACKEEIDGKYLVMACINCGWSKERERYAQVLHRQTA